MIPYVGAAVLIAKLGLVELRERIHVYSDRMCIEQQYIYAEPYTGDPSCYPWGYGALHGETMTDKVRRW